jgi:hypothetical protein
MVGTPVSAMALMSGPWAPTRERSSSSTCSPVLVWSQGLIDVLGGVLWLAKTVFHSRCIQALPELILIPRPSSNNDDGNVRFLSCFNGLGES